jgi:hypothetical protein
MSNLKASSEKEIETKLAKSRRSQEAFREFHIKDNDFRKLIAPEKTLSPQMIEVKEKIQNIAKTALNKKIITANKYNQLNLVLNESKTELDLESVWKELKKYLG